MSTLLGALDYGILGFCAINLILGWRLVLRAGPGNSRLTYAFMAFGFALAALNWYFEPRRDGPKYVRVLNAAIPSHDDRRVARANPDDCKRECTKDPDCESFDYHKTERYCELSAASSENTSLRTDYPNNPYDHYIRVNFD